MFGINKFKKSKNTKKQQTEEIKTINEVKNKTENKEVKSVEKEIKSETKSTVKSNKVKKISSLQDFLY